jgi:dephospho-CoA kinase
MIVGITGTLGAGKGTIVEFLKQKGFMHFSVREYLNSKLESKGLPLNRDNLANLANELRTENSPSFIVEQLLERAKDKAENVIIESIRSVAEAKLIKQEGILLAVDADPKIRYARISARKSETDKISYEKFLEQEKREMFSTNPYEQNLSECIKMADFVLKNNETIEILNEKMGEAYTKILKRVQ